MRGRLRRTKAPSMSAGRTLVVALILFAMLCGLTLVIAGRGLPAGYEQQVDRAFRSIKQAGDALEATNYGETRRHLTRAREHLARLSEQK